MLPSLISHNIKLLNAYHISADSLTLEDSPYRIVFEIQNRNMNKKIQLKAKTELGFFTILNSGTTEELRHSNSLHFINLYFLPFFLTNDWNQIETIMLREQKREPETIGNQKKIDIIANLKIS